MKKRAVTRPGITPSLPAPSAMRSTADGRANTAMVVNREGKIFLILTKLRINGDGYENLLNPSPWQSVSAFFFNAIFFYCNFFFMRDETVSSSVID